MRDLAAYEIRRLHRKVNDLERRVALAQVTGKVKEIDHGKRLLRLEIGQTADGQPILSPWVRWDEPGNAFLKVHIPPTVGAQMTLVNPGGTIGEASHATWSTYDDPNPAPSQAEDTAVQAAGSSRIEMKDGEILIKTASKLTVDVGGEAFEVTPEQLEMKKRFVAKGGTKPASGIGDLDDGGDKLIEGNPDMLV